MREAKLATFAAGCFWGTEAAYQKFKDYGIVKTKVGYTGGETTDPSYEAVCSKKTGHAEAVQIIYNPSIISYQQLLKIFWLIHDPTQLNRQGNDLGNQYRSAIFYHDDQQKKLAETSKQEQSSNYNRPIVTEIVAAQTFFDAEDYHQEYLNKHPGGYCHVNLERIEPKEVLGLD